MEFIKQTIEHLKKDLQSNTDKYKDLQHEKELAVAMSEYSKAAEIKKEQDKLTSYFHCLDWLESL